MKTTQLTLLVALSLFLTTLTFAQNSAKGFSFQGYAIDPEGKAITSERITVRFSLSPGTFEEEHDLTSDAFGVFHAIIGSDENQDFAKLDFNKKDVIYTLKVEVKKTVGGAYTTISNEPMNAVPYARHAENGVPVGTIIAYGGELSSIPAGWKLCNGASLNKTVFPRLFAVIGSAWGGNSTNFNLPDLRGRFLRGVDQNAGNDPDRNSRTAIATGGNSGDNVGSVQGQSTSLPNGISVTITGGTHYHGYNDRIHNSNQGSGAGAGSYYASPNGNWSNRINDTPGHNNTIPRNTENADHSHTASVGGGAAETRPKNAGVYYIIKY